MANYNYIKENYKEFVNMIYGTLDRVPITNQEARDNFRNYTLPDYIKFLYDLNFLTMDRNNPLNSQKEYCEKLFILCDRVRKNGLESEIPNQSAVKFIEKLQQYMKDWAHNDLDDELKKQERVYYTALAFNKEEPAPKQYANRIAQLKNQIQTKNIIKGLE
jgi:hypothetical protein